jgi:hypothetical protein
MTERQFHDEGKLLASLAKEFVETGTEPPKDRPGLNPAFRCAQYGFLPYAPVGTSVRRATQRRGHPRAIVYKNAQNYRHAR